LKGIKAPFWFRDTFINTIGNREAEKALQLGTLFTPEQALDIKLVDEIVEPKDVLAVAEQEMSKWLKIPGKFKI
jgi:3,2-trans-enoyl-CoA isomerase